VPPAETFEEYMKRRAAQGGKKNEVVQAKQQVYSAKRAGDSEYRAMYLRP
jgi:hypothetical protein